MNKGVAVNGLVQKFSGASKMFIGLVFCLLVVGFFIAIVSPFVANKLTYHIDKRKIKYSEGNLFCVP